MTITQAVIMREQFRERNAPEKFEARIKAKAEELFPESWRKEVAAAVIAQFAAQATGF